MSARSVLLSGMFFCLACTATMIAQTDIAGDWQGAISLPGVDLGIIVHFSGTTDSLRATIDIPMQMAKGLPLSNVRAVLPSVHFELPAGPGLAVFQGALAGDSIAGDFRQGSVAARFCVRLTGGPQPAAAVPPPPYHEEEVRIPNGDVTLAGTLSMPPSGGPFPCAILLTGSGAQNRDEEIFGFAPFKILADHLTRDGFAVLRCDDRGVGGSTGNLTNSTAADFSRDALAMHAYLAARPEINHASIGLIGHSEGGEVAVMTAATSRDIAFVVLLAGPSVPGDSTVLSQIEMLGQLQGESEENIKRGLALERRVFAVVKSQKGWDDLRAALLAEMRRSLERLSADQRSSMPNTDSTLAARVDMQMNAVRTPWFAFFISHDPGVDIAKINCPVLALFGELDKQVSPSLNLRPMSSALSRSGNPDVEVAVIPGVNHLFQKAVTGNVTEYAGLEKKFADGVLDRVTGWLKKRFR
jgi:uncharacterized protein